MSEDAPPPQSRTVLVVDDESAVRLTVVYCLELGGFAAVAADSAATAVELSQQGVFDAALIDIRMPRTDGFACAAQLLAHARQRHRPLPIWFMTGCPTTADRERAEKLGARGLLRKPFDFPALLKELEQALRR